MPEELAIPETKALEDSAKALGRARLELIRAQIEFAILAAELGVKDA